MPTCFPSLLAGQWRTFNVPALTLGSYNHIRFKYSTQNSWFISYRSPVGYDSGLLPQLENQVYVSSTARIGVRWQSKASKAVPHTRILPTPRHPAPHNRIQPHSVSYPIPSHPTSSIHTFFICFAQHASLSSHPTLTSTVAPRLQLHQYEGQNRLGNTALPNLLDTMSLGEQSKRRDSKLVITVLSV